MAQILLIMKIYPEGDKVDLDDLENNITNVLKSDMKLRKYEKLPLAFGINYLRCEFVIDEIDGALDELEKSINSITGVSQSEIINQSRLSVDI
ncbi:MAG: elongation factor 1-beta [Nitrosopumilaceae archaeon]|nr:elongation factor 1-beta [Nitrosopumilaceae archaeon]